MGTVMDLFTDIQYEIHTSVRAYTRKRKASGGGEGNCTQHR